MERIPCVILGLGRIGSTLEDDPLREKPASHAGSIRADRRAVLAGGADPVPRQRTSFVRRWHVAPNRVYEDPADALDALRPAQVHIASDTDTHADLLRLCLHRQVPVIVCEKPLAATLEEARNLLPLVEDAAAAGTSRVVVNHERRFARDWRQVREWIVFRRFGPLVSVHARLFMGRTRDRESVLWHDGTHMVDILRFLCGPWDVDHVSTTGAGATLLVSGHTRERPDAQSPVLSDLEGSPAPLPRDPAGWDHPVAISLEAGPGRDYLEFEADLSFARGRVRVGNGVWEVAESRESPHYKGFRSLAALSPPGRNPWKNRTGYFREMTRHALDLHSDPHAIPLSSCADALAALEILDTIIARL